MKITTFIKIYLFTFLLGSCATSRIQLKEEQKTEVQPKFTTKKESFYIIGNTSKSESSPTLNALQKVIVQDSSEKKHLIFIGDNTNEKNEDRVKADLDREINIIKQTNIDPVFVPGNFDWEYNAVEGLEVIEDYFEEKLNIEDVLKPNNGCPLESVEINDDIQLILIDSQWYLEDWDLHPNINDKCEIKTREKFILEVAGEIKKYRNKTIIFAMHHPMLTNGLHGGKFSFRDHIFPLQGNIPLPGIATMITQIRAQGGISIQDRFNKRYNELMEKLRIVLDEEDNRIIIVSGHEMNLQYIEEKNIKQLISGAGSDIKPVAIGNNGLFSYGKNGFSSLDFLQDGSVSATFYKVANDGNAQVIYKKKVFEPVQKPVLDTLPTKFPKTYTASVYNLEKVEKSDFFKSFWGDHYRDVYGKKVKARTAVLDTLYSGLEVIRPSGGHQTRSLRLETKEGKEYNMRALKKSAVQLLETTAYKGIDKEYFTNTIPEELILDFYTAAHPYGAFAIPKIAKAAGVYYTTPELFYVPQQKSLGKYNKEYGDQLYMIVEKPSEEFKDRKSFGYPDDVESTDDLLNKLREDEDYTLDEEIYIRARIFDMLIGDWDRHSDQWRWAEFENEDGKKVFVPIPRDRDQVFANFDGSFLNLLRTFLGGTNQFGVYGENIENVKWFNNAGSKLDRALVKRSDRSTWIEQAKFLQQAIDLNTLDEAFASLPLEVQDATLEEIKQSFIKRKNNLVDIVDRYYNSFIEFQMLTGTDKDDYFEITRFEDGKTRIKGNRIKDGEKGDLLFDRVFDSKETKEIWLYGLDDDDIFEVHGDAKKPVLIRIIGGQDEDTYDISEGRKIKVYDRRTNDNNIKNKGGAHFKFTDFYDANLYNYQKSKTKKAGISFKTGFNPDDGSVISLSYEKEVNDFIENPYGKRTEVALEYQFLTQGLDLRFNKKYAAIFRDFNFIFNGRYTSTNYTENFFGYGNETINLDNTLTLDYNRVNLEMYNAGIGFERETDYGSLFQVKFDIETVRVGRSGNNLIENSNFDGIGERSYFGIPNITYSYKNFDDPDFPSKGMFFMTSIGGIDDLKNDNLTGFLKSNITFYNSIKTQRLILKTEANTYLMVGDEPKFYQSAQLGNRSGLRGYRAQRFTGMNSLVGNADLFYNFQELKTFLFPIGISIYGGYDIGRVWVKDENSKVWHSSYGGGFIFKWTDAIQGQFSIFRSEEDTTIKFGFGLTF